MIERLEILKCSSLNSKSWSLKLSQTFLACFCFFTPFQWSSCFKSFGEDSNFVTFYWISYSVNAFVVIVVFLAVYPWTKGWSVLGHKNHNLDCSPTIPAQLVVDQLTQVIPHPDWMKHTRFSSQHQAVQRARKWARDAFREDQGWPALL